MTILSTLAVCKEIRERIYPEELRSAAADPSKDRSAIERWFANHTGAGASAIRRMTQFYLILLEARRGEEAAKPEPQSPTKGKRNGVKNL